MKKIAVLSFVISILLMNYTFASNNAIKDDYSMYFSEYASIEYHTIDIMNAFYSVVEIMNEKIDSGEKLSDSEIQLYFEYTKAMFLFDIVVNEQRAIAWESIDSSISDLFHSYNGTNRQIYPLLEHNYENWLNGTDDDVIETVSWMRRLVDSMMSMYPVE